MLAFSKYQNGSSMQNHVFKTEQVSSIDNCHVECFIDKKCVSLNVGPLDDGQWACELSDSDHMAHPNDMRNRSGYLYLSFKNNDCHKVKCAKVNETCRPFLTVAGGYECFCKRGDECDMDGGWTEWSTWSACSTTEYSGSRTRTRQCTDPTPQRNGANCAGDSSQSMKCYMTVRIISKAFEDRSGQTGIYVDGQERITKGLGHNFVSFYMNGTFHSNYRVNTGFNPSSGSLINNYIRDLPNNILVLVAVDDTVIWEDPTSGATGVPALRSIGAHDPVIAGRRQSWVLIGYKGTGSRPWVVQKHADRGEGPTVIEKNIPTEVSTTGNPYFE